MLPKLRARLTYANVMSSLAFFFAVGGGAAFAATQLSDNSVRSRHIVNGEVRTGDVRAEAITKGRLADDAVNGRKVSPDSLRAADLAAGAARTPEIADRAVVQSKLAAPEAPRQVGAPGQPPLGSEWENASPTEGAAFYRDPYGRVHLSGQVARNSGTGESTIFTLPAGYRPAATTYNGVISNADWIARVDVDPAGDVRYLLGGDPGAILALDGVSFRCGPAGVNGCP